MIMYDLIEYSDNYLEDLSELSEHLEVHGITMEMNHFQIMVLLMIFLLIIIVLKYKTKIANRTGDYGIKNVKIRVPLKQFSNFWRTLEMP